MGVHTRARKNRDHYKSKSTIKMISILRKTPDLNLESDEIRKSDFHRGSRSGSIKKKIIIHVYYFKRINGKGEIMNYPPRSKEYTSLSITIYSKKKNTNWSNSQI